MNLRHLRPVRVLRVQLGLARVLPAYLRLLFAEYRAKESTDQADWDRAHQRAAREIKRVALAYAGAFVKGAQIGGARADVLPAVFIDELSQFHDAVPPRPFEALRPIVEGDLGRPLGDVFAEVDPQALAAASLAQVHRARLHDGREVVLKIQYPEARRIIPLDLKMVRFVGRVANRIQRFVDLRALVDEVTRFIERELDFANEVASTKRLAEVLDGRPDVVVPDVVDKHCGPNLIVLEYLDGIQVTRTAELVEAGHKPADVARRVGGLYGAMIFELSFFHGDPHPGNLLVLGDGRIGLLDYGLCKELPEGFALLVARMMVSAMIGDSADALDAAASLGFDTRTLRADHLRSLMLKTIGDSDGDENVFEIFTESRIERIPEDFALVVRTLILLNGLSERLVPHRRLVQAAVLEHLASGAARAGGTH